MGKETFIISLVLFNIIFLLLLVAIVVFIKQYRKKKKIHLVELTNQKESHNKELLQTKLEIQDRITQHLGREIHDNVGQKLTLASIYLQQYDIETIKADSTKLLEDVKELIDGSLVELRELSKMLTNDSIKQGSITSLIREEIERVNKIDGINITFNSENKVSINSYQIKIVLLRVTQEFIQNSLKHAKCKNISIEMKETNDSLEITMLDDGEGFDIQNYKSDGIGLNNIKKRITMLNGNFTLSSKDPIGTKMILKIPKL